MIIDCSDCEMHETDHCKDCFVMAVLSRKKEAPFVIEVTDDQQEAITALQNQGLAPLLKFKRKAV